MAEKTEAQKKAQKKYMEKFVVAQVRMERTKYTDIQAAAAAAGESVNAYINGAIDTRMGAGSPQEAAETSAGAGVVSLPPNTLEAAEQAAKRTGETVAAFVTRAVANQEKRDDKSFKMGINPA